MTEVSGSEMERAYLDTIAALATALDSRDRYGIPHSRRVSSLALAVGRLLGTPEAELRLLQYAALLHDVGKIGVPGSVLNKPGPLSPEELAIVRQHPLIAERILASVPFLAPVLPVIRAAHEHWDGSGYPDGLAGEAIPPGARILHACDAFCALEAGRPYRLAWPRQKIVDELTAQSGRQYDPTVITALLDVVRSDDADAGAAVAVPSFLDAPLEALDWAHQMELLEAMGPRLTEARSAHEICRLIGEVALRLIPHDRCETFLLSLDGKTLERSAVCDAEGEKCVEPKRIMEEGENPVALSDSLAGRVAASSQGVVLTGNEMGSGDASVGGLGHRKSALAVPVIFKDELLAVIALERAGVNKFSRNHLRLLTIVANQAGASIANLRLIDRLSASARTDPLTGLDNRRSLAERLPETLRSASAVSVAVLDVDRLKAINDVHGHEAGDRVIRWVADVVRAELRPEDLAVRWGGDEFVILFSGIARSTALAAVERIRSALLAPPPGAPPVSISVGIATYPMDGTTMDQLLRAADHAMYAAKRRDVAS